MMRIFLILLTIFCSCACGAKKTRSALVPPAPVQSRVTATVAGDGNSAPAQAKPKPVMTKERFCNMAFYVYDRPLNFLNYYKYSGDEGFIRFWAVNLAIAGGCEW